MLGGEGFIRKTKNPSFPSLSCCLDSHRHKGNYFNSFLQNQGWISHKVGTFTQQLLDASAYHKLKPHTPNLPPPTCFKQDKTS